MDNYQYKPVNQVSETISERINYDPEISTDCGHSEECSSCDRKHANSPEKVGINFKSTGKEDDDCKLKTTSMGEGDDGVVGQPPLTTHVTDGVNQNDHREPRVVHWCLSDVEMDEDCRYQPREKTEMIDTRRRASDAMRLDEDNGFVFYYP